MTKDDKPGLVASDGKPIDSPAPRCGNCLFWHIDMQQGTGAGWCHGEPPRLMMTAPPRPGPTQGSVSYTVEKFRPLMSKTESPCRHWKPKDYDLARAVAPSANVH